MCDFAQGFGVAQPGPPPPSRDHPGTPGRGRLAFGPAPSLWADCQGPWTKGKAPGEGLRPPSNETPNVQRQGRPRACPNNRQALKIKDGGAPGPISGSLAHAKAKARSKNLRTGNNVRSPKNMAGPRKGTGHVVSCFSKTIKLIHLMRPIPHHPQNTKLAFTHVQTMSLKVNQA
jgi:hypothetical protein